MRKLWLLCVSISISSALDIRSIDFSKCADAYLKFDSQKISFLHSSLGGEIVGRERLIGTKFHFNDSGKTSIKPRDCGFLTLKKFAWGESNVRVEMQNCVARIESVYVGFRSDGDELHFLADNGLIKNENEIHGKLWKGATAASSFRNEKMKEWIKIWADCETISEDGSSATGITDSNSEPPVDSLLKELFQ